MQAGVDTNVVVANVPSNVLDPKTKVARQLSPCAPIARQQALPAASEDGACQCREAAAASAAAAHEAHGDDSSHESSAVNGGAPATEQQASTLSPAVADCPNDAAEPLPESAGEGKGEAGTHMAVAGLQWDLPEGVDLSDCLMLWLGEEDAPALTQLMLTYSRCFALPVTWP